MMHQGSERVVLKMSTIKGCFVTGIGTEIGKTIVSAIVVEALQASYWKPVQAGELDNSDSMKIASLSSSYKKIHPEYARLKTPMSPHAAAKIDEVLLKVAEVHLPQDFPLVVEGAGGLLVPLNENETIADLIAHLGLPTLLVSRHYLGSINHTLLSLELLHQRGLAVAGVIFVGEETPSTEQIISMHTSTPVLGRVPHCEDLSTEFVTSQARLLSKPLREVLQLS